MANGQKQDGSIVTAEIADGAVTTPKIANGAVTYAKMQDVSATDRLLGRVSASSGVVEEVVLDTDGMLAADSDDRVPTQKAVKTYVDAAVASSGGADIRVSVPQSLNLTTTISLYAASSLSTPVPSTGNYKLRFSGYVYSITSPGNTIIFQSATARAISRYRPSDRSTATLYAANTNIVTFDKGSALAAADSFSSSGSSFALTAGDLVGADAASPAAQYIGAKITGTSAGVTSVISLVSA